ncbi:MAG: ketoacyl-ACP synthase III [Proteobacteria bacterium]|nr:ketoacyl-ACP synthase III [Pseudomonadota bacterium]
MTNRNQIYIKAIEYFLPSRVVTNDELKAANPQWNMAQISAKTGVVSRRLAGETEFASDLAFHAILKLIDQTGIAKNDIDGLLFCTQSPDYIMPPNSTILHSRLGLRKQCLAFDFTLACSGFVYGLAIAKSLLESLNLENIVLVTADTYSKYIHPRDRAASTLFGDGAAATLVGRYQGGTSTSQVLDFLLETDGAGGPCFAIKAGGLRFPKTSETSVIRRDVTGNEWTDDKIKMDGRGVLDFAKREIPGAVERILSRNDLSLNNIDMILFHQASAYALETLTQQMKIPPEKTFSNISHVGNTVSASLAILLRDAELAGKVHRNDLVLLVGFGVGFSWGCCLLRW